MQWIAALLFPCLKGRSTAPVKLTGAVETCNNVTSITCNIVPVLVNQS